MFKAVHVNHDLSILGFLVSISCSNSYIIIYRDNLMDALF